MARLILAVFLCVLAGCGARRPAPRDARYPMSDDAQVRCAVFRHLLREHPQGMTAFISFGQADGRWIDPPPTFAACLADRNLIVKPASGARLPQPGKGGTVMDPATKKPARLYYVRITRWRDDDHAAVEGGRIDAMAPAAGMNCTVKRVARDLWRIDEANFW